MIGYLPVCQCVPRSVCFGILLVDASVATSASLFVVILIVGLLAAGRTTLTVGALVELGDEALLVFSRNRVDDGLGGKGLGEELLGLWGEAGGELDVKLDDQQSSVVGVALDRHTLVGDNLDGLFFFFFFF